MAVGYYNDGSGYPKALAERWDGVAWSWVPTPDLPGTPPPDVNLRQVSCTSEDFCMAVGGSYSGASGYTALAELWDGTTWSISPTPLSPQSRFMDVSCKSPTFCIAVGDGTPTTPDQGGLARQWDGSRWSSMTTANPVGPTSSPRTIGFTGVSCPSVTFCVAVGVYDGRTLAEQHGNSAGLSV